MLKKYFSLAILILFTLPVFIPAQTPPDKFLGHKVGEDRKLADYEQIQAYFKKLDEESDKMTVVTIGETTLKKPMIMAIITHEENMDKLDTFRGITKKLRDARDLTPDDARKLAREGKVIALITCSLHASEVAASQMSMELAYKLVTGQTPFDAQRVLKDVILLLCPTINPDGNQMVVDWYRKNVGTEYEDARMPWLYHYYAGHDNNRDFFMFNLPESRAVTEVLYHEWIPQIHIDEHQMGSTGARLFVPPFMNPPVPVIHPLLWRGVALFGTNMAYDLQKNNFSGVVHSRSYTGWWIGACDDTSWLHNTIGLLSEMASVKTASPIYIDPTELPDSYVEKRLEFPDPWPGGWWRLRDLVDYELTLSMSLVKTAYLNKEDLLFNFFKMNQDAIEKQEPGQPFAFVIPKEQRDYPTTLRFLETVKFGGVKIHQAKEDFVADGKVFSAGSFVVLMSQPYRPYAQALLEKQKYPDMRQYPGGPPIPPYDNAGWTLPLQMGVRCEQINGKFKTDLAELNEIPKPEIDTSSMDSDYIVFDSKKNASFSIVFNLLKNKAEVFRSKKGINGEGWHACIGSFIVKNTPAVKKVLPDLLKKWNMEALALNDVSNIAKDPLKKFRVGLYQSWRANMDEGWTRYVFDDFEIPFTTLHNKDFKGADKKPVNLKEKFDTIVFADESPDIIKSGQPSPNSPYARYFSGTAHPEYSGGIGKEGVDALKKFVEEGGILVTMNSASGLAISEFKAPASNVIERVSRDQFFCPTSILKVKVDNTTPIGYGMAPETAVVFSRSPAFSTRIPSGDWDRKVVASYPSENILMSGWLLGENALVRKSAVVDLSYKKGHIILIGFRCQHRAQSHGSYKFLLNALLYPENN